MKVLKYQFWHVLGFILLFYAADNMYLALNIPMNKFWGVPTYYWFLICIFASFVHQVCLACLWRAELYYKTLSKRFGKKSFTYFQYFFWIFVLIRIISFIGVVSADKDSLKIQTLPRIFFPIIFLILAIWAMYSTLKYFSIKRASGYDHFNPEECRNKKMVCEGSFKYCANSMYSFFFLIFWAVALIFASKAALVLAFFLHFFIWLHYFCTEKPDMDYIYKSETED